MQEWLISLLGQYSTIAPLIVFIALVLAAFNIPISEDLTVIAAGMFVATVNPHEGYMMHLALIAGAIGGDMLSYAMGRKIGRPLLQKYFFRRMVLPHKLETLSRHFAKHAALTILFGRLVPFGIRNGISLLAGITHLPSWKFLLFDTLSGSFSISVIYLLSKHYSVQLLGDIRTVQVIVLLLLLLVVAYIVFRIFHKKPVPSVTAPVIAAPKIGPSKVIARGEDPKEPCRYSS